MTPLLPLSPRVSAQSNPKRRQKFFVVKLILMQKFLFLGLALSSGLVALPAVASEELFKKSNCLACHAIDQKRLGPSMKEVATKYNGDASAADMLAKKIRAGGGGVWEIGRAHV